MSSSDKIAGLGIQIHLKSQSKKNKKYEHFPCPQLIINHRVRGLVRFTAASQPAGWTMAGHIPSGYNLLPLCGIQILVSVKRFPPTFLNE